LLLYYITDRTQFADDEAARRARLLERISAAAHAGVDYIQLRENDLRARELEQLANAALEAIRSASSSSTRLLINSRCDVALAAGAAGVHLRSGAQDISPADARALLVRAGMTSPIVAASCHTASEVALAASEGADFAVFGPVFGKGPDATHEAVTAMGIEGLCAACAAAVGGMPVLALGAVTIENAAECLRAGAAGVAGIRLFQESDLAKTIRRLRALG
jgi:thiamine-phosphate pyrophosphorylase